MKNVAVDINGTVMTITVDLGADYGKSKSGKNTVIASTEGNITLEGGVTLGLNCYRK